MAAPSSDSKALRQIMNEKTAKCFGIAIGSFIGLFILSHWARFFYQRYTKGKNSTGTAVVIRLLRYAVSVPSRSDVCS